jgi:divalent metal cation (Fe/Co/Zn/Cd) transporter
MTDVDLARGRTPDRAFAPDWQVLDPIMAIGWRCISSTGIDLLRRSTHGLMDAAA